MTREEMISLLTEWEQYKKAHCTESDGIDIDKLNMYQFATIKSRLPPAEGAEEILKNRLGEQFGLLTPFGLENLIAAMTDFATLHAQRLAEKMVEEKMSELSNDPKFLFDICLSFRHDFGLLSAELQEGINFQAKEWLRAIQNNLKTRER